ncbi:MAG: RIO-like serine/threonine protein kinase fused to N-terminal HTH domain protein [Haloquadratum sp. J07HQX50]|jgi:serine/threonine protein kinase|nr:MAG: RIO-like serine/threonine protein kinase fused to N-terminal HTH domain protein [Haloquadratum sp. J07HQX50]
MVRNVAGIMTELESEDFYLLSGVEQGMRFSEWVNRKKIPSLSNLSPEEVSYRLDRCAKRELIERKTIQYEGYTLTAEGYDALALHTFAERETIDGVGAPLGVGKESDVLEVRAHKPMAMKFHREGYTNFREVMRERNYTSEREHVSWLYTARKAAEREYNALAELYPTVNVPRPIEQNRHAIVMEKFSGVELNRTKIPPEQVSGVLSLILSEIATTYEEGYVHCDMSEYNVAINESEVTIFDWPQAVPTTHQNSAERLTRDISNLINYFQRKYPQVAPDVSPADISGQIQSGRFDSHDIIG